jgi:hypothetical protein
LPGAVRISNNNSKLWNSRIRHRVDHFSAVLNDAAVLSFTSHHKTTYILQEKQWNLRWLQFIMKRAALSAESE